MGDVRVDATGRLRFPTAPERPALYRFSIEAVDTRPGVYIGEAADLRRRLQSYRTPGRRQPTNVRMNAALLHAIQTGGSVTLWVATDASVSFGPTAPTGLDLSRKSQRLAAEQAAIVEALLAEDLDDMDGNESVRPRLLNKPGIGETPYE
jgi:hypothetical protein